MTEDWLHLTEASAGELQALHRTYDLSVVHYAASVADKTLPQAVLGLLKAMGKDPNVTGMRVHASQAVQVLPVWLAAHDTKVVLLSRAQSWQRPGILTGLIRLLAATATTVVVATDPGIPGTVAATLRGMCPSTVMPDELTNLLDRASDSAHQREEPAPLTPSRVEVPSSDWATFRYDCRMSLPVDDFARVDAAYIAAFADARSALTDSPPTNEFTRDRLTHILRISRDTAEATAAFRGTQAAYFEAGYNLRLDPSRVISLYAHTRPPAFTERDWMALRAYLDPARPATCTLYAHGLTLAEIAAFRIGDAESALRHGSLNEQPLSHHAVTYLTANLLQRSNEESGENAPFIPLTPISRVLTAAGKDVGILTAGKPTQTSAHTKAIWTAGTGFLLKAIA